MVDEGWGDEGGGSHGSPKSWIDTVTMTVTWAMCHHTAADTVSPYCSRHCVTILQQTLCHHTAADTVTILQQTLCHHTARHCHDRNSTLYNIVTIMTSIDTVASLWQQSSAMFSLGQQLYNKHCCNITTCLHTLCHHSNMSAYTLST